MYTAGSQARTEEGSGAVRTPQKYKPTADHIEAYNRCNPNQALQGKELEYWHVDCSDVRGVGPLVDRLAERITFPASSGQWGHALLAGHRGCGKSTELQRLRQQLDGDGFLTVYVEAHARVTSDNLDAEAVILIAMQELVAQLAGKGVKLNSSKLEAVSKWFDEVEVSEEDTKEAAAEIGGEAGAEANMLVARLMAVFKGHIRRSHREDKKTTTQQRRYLSDLQESLNDLLADASRIITGKGAQARGLVLIMDGLDRIEDAELQTEVFVDYRDLFSGLGVHTVFTVPIALVCSEHSQDVQDTFGAPEVLPSIQIETPEGLEKARDIVLKRCDESLFAPDVVDFVCRASGGDVRDIMLMVREAILRTPPPKPPITMEGALAAFHALGRSFSNWLTNAHYDVLATHHADRELPPTDTHGGQLLMAGALLCYWNGENWYEVHPAIRGLRDLYPQTPPLAGFERSFHVSTENEDG